MTAEPYADGQPCLRCCECSGPVTATLRTDDKPIFAGEVFVAKDNLLTLTP